MDLSWTPETALVVVDVQNDFADPKGSLSVRGGLEIVPTVNRLIDEATRTGAVVAYTRDWHPERTPHFKKDGGIWPDHCVQGTWGAELVPGLVRASAAVMVHKGAGGEDGYSGFTMREPMSGRDIETGLGPILRRLGVKRVVVVGLATDYCVRATALDALERGFETSVVREAVRPVELKPGDGERALREVASRGGRIV